MFIKNKNCLLNILRLDLIRGIRESEYDILLRNTGGDSHQIFRLASNTNISNASHRILTSKIVHWRKFINTYMG